MKVWEQEEHFPRDTKTLKVKASGNVTRCWNKSSLIFTKDAQNIANVVFSWKVMLSK